MRFARDIVKPVVVLTLIALAVGAALAFAYRLTALEGGEGPDMALIDTAGKEAMPKADGFEPAEKPEQENFYLFRAKNGAGLLVQGETIGYNTAAPIRFVVGFEPDGTITGVHILSQEETPGLGSLVAEDSFTDQFAGINGEVSAENIDALAGATYTTNGICEGINKARTVFEEGKGALQ